MLKALVAYARELGGSVCAEGVEDVADLDHLNELGVTHAQVYLLGRPGAPWQSGRAAPESTPTAEAIDTLT